MGRGRFRRLASVTLLTSFVIGVLSGTAYAGTAASAYGYYTVGGTQYQNQAAVNTDPSYSHQAYAVTLVSPYSGNPAQPGWAGAEPRIFRNGVLVCADTWV